MSDELARTADLRAPQQVRSENAGIEPPVKPEDFVMEQISGLAEFLTIPEGEIGLLQALAVRRYMELIDQVHEGDNISFYLPTPNRASKSDGYFRAESRKAKNERHRIASQLKKNGPNLPDSVSQEDLIVTAAWSTVLGYFEDPAHPERRNNPRYKSTVRYGESEKGVQGEVVIVRTWNGRKIQFAVPMYIGYVNGQRIFVPAKDDLVGFADGSDIAQWIMFNRGFKQGQDYEIGREEPRHLLDTDEHDQGLWNAIKTNVRSGTNPLPPLSTDPIGFAQGLWGNIGPVVIGILHPNVDNDINGEQMVVLQSTAEQQVRSVNASMRARTLQLMAGILMGTYYIKDNIPGLVNGFVDKEAMALLLQHAPAGSSEYLSGVLTNLAGYGTNALIIGLLAAIFVGVQKASFRLSYGAAPIKEGQVEGKIYEEIAESQDE